jgi:hypothetical protein
MTGFFETPLGKIWYDENIPCLFTSIKPNMTEADSKTLLSKELKITKSILKKTRSLCSVTILDCDSFDTIPPYFNDHISETIKMLSSLSLRNKMFVLPQRPKSVSSEDLKVHSMDVRFYQSFSEALSAINALKYIEVHGINKTQNKPSYSVWNMFTIERSSFGEI